MTTEEFSREFDVLYNNIMSNAAPGLDEYEKSVFLTKAQSQIIKEYFNPRVDQVNQGFDGSQKRQYDFSNLIRVATLFPINSVTTRITDIEKLDKRSIPYIMPHDYFLSVNEILYDGVTQYSVIPLQYSEYQRVMMKPYALPIRKGAWRLITDKKNCNYFNDKITGTECNYEFLSSWADQKRSLNITIKTAQSSTALALPTNSLTPEVASGSEIYFYYEGYRTYLQVRTGWNTEATTYEVALTLTSDLGVTYDDEEVFEAIKVGFQNYKKWIISVGGNIETADTALAKAARHTDMMINSSAPSKYKECSTESGYLIEATCIALPIAEIIGKFQSTTTIPTYQIRYVKKPYPIILTSFQNSNVSIEGEIEIHECELPSEIHPEILERAVLLARAVYKDGQSTGARQQQQQ